MEAKKQPAKKVTLGNHPRHLRNFMVAGKSDYDYAKYFRVLKGRLTKARYKAIDRQCRKFSQRFHCGHEHDCCGCLCGQSMSFIHNANTNKTLIIASQSFNY